MSHLPSDILDHLARISARTAPEWPVTGWISGETALAHYLGPRPISTLAISWSSRLAIPDDLRAFLIVFGDESVAVSLETRGADLYPLSHPDWQEASSPLVREKSIDYRIISGLDLAVTLMGSAGEADLADIAGLAVRCGFSGEDLRVRTEAALADIIGDVSHLRENLEMALDRMRPAIPTVPQL